MWVPQNKFIPDLLSDAGMSLNIIILRHLAGNQIQLFWAASDRLTHQSCYWGLSLNVLSRQSSVLNFILFLLRVVSSISTDLKNTTTFRSAAKKLGFLSRVRKYFLPISFIFFNQTIFKILLYREAPSSPSTPIFSILITERSFDLLMNQLSL